MYIYGNYRGYFYAPNNILRQELEQTRDGWMSMRSIDEHSNVRSTETKRCWSQSRMAYQHYGPHKTIFLDKCLFLGLQLNTSGLNGTRQLKYCSLSIDMVILLFERIFFSLSIPWQFYRSCNWPRVLYTVLVLFNHHLQHYSQQKTPYLEFGLSPAFHSARLIHAKTSPLFKLFSVSRVNTNSQTRLKSQSEETWWLVLLKHAPSSCLIWESTFKPSKNTAWILKEI